MALDGTYAGLQASIASTLGRDDLGAAIKDWIALCEDDLRTSLGLHDQEKRLTFDISTANSTLPADFNMQRALVLVAGSGTAGIRIPMKFLAPAQVADLYPFDITGMPRHFTVRNQVLTVYPSPDVSYAATLDYIANVPSLTDLNNTNVILTAYPRAYFYGSLMHSAPFLGGAADTRLVMWSSLRDKAVSDMIANDVQYKFGGGSPSMSSDYVY